MRTPVGTLEMYTCPALLSAQCLLRISRVGVCTCLWLNSLPVGSGAFSRLELHSMKLGKGILGQSSSDNAAT